MASSIGYINKAVELGVGEHFKPEYVTPETLEDYKLEGLGIGISQWSDYNIVSVLKIFMGALEDMNRHTKADVIQDWLDEIKRDEEKSDCIFLKG